MKTPYVHLLVTCFLIILVQSCGEDNRFTGPDYSTVPDPYDISDAVSDSTTDDGLTIYVIDEGYGNPESVNARDQVQARYTGRTEDGDVFDSTWGNGSEQPRTLQNLTTEPIPSQVGQTVSPLIDGFRRGILGMKKGEKRKIIVPPHLGYGESGSGSGGSLEGETLIFDVEIVEIL